MKKSKPTGKAQTPLPPDSKPPAINCAHDKLEDPARLKLNPKNPNKHGPDQLKLYARIVLHQGWRKSIVVSNQSGMVVTGEGAVLTARAQAWPTVPVDYQDFASPADEFAHMLADNRLPQMADLDEAALADILRDEIEPHLDKGLAGFSLDEPAGPVELKPVDVKQPPKMAWVLVGIPLVRFSEINAAVERIAKIEGVILESTVNDTEEVKL